MIQLQLTKNDLLWLKHHVFHNNNGPAIIYKSGTKSWFVNGYYHRLDGPAIELASGDKWWYINGTLYSELEYWLTVQTIT